LRGLSVAKICPKCGAKFDDRVNQCPNDGAKTLVIGDEQGLVGKTIDGRFTIRSLIGVGGMGAVYRAHQHSMDRDVALKVLHKELASNEQEVMRFFREAKAASSLTGAHTITVFDFGQTEDGMLYLVMELLRGQSLADLMEANPGPMDHRRAVGIIRQVLEALVQAHAAGVLHRDLKPDNVFMISDEASEDFVKVLDFGIAKLIGRESTNLTATGMVVGTPTYMSPEQGLGEDLDARSDLYATGVMLFEMLTGKPPFEAESPVAVVVKKVHEPAPSLLQINPGIRVPGQLEKAVAGILATDPGDRPADARETRQLLLRSLGSGFEKAARESSKQERAAQPSEPAPPPSAGPPPAARPERPARLPTPRPATIRPRTAVRPKARMVPKRRRPAIPRIAALAGAAVALAIALVIWAVLGSHGETDVIEKGKDVQLDSVAEQIPRVAELPVSERSALPIRMEEPAQGLLEALRSGKATGVELQIDRLVTMRKAAQIGNLTPLAAIFVSKFDKATAEVTPIKAAKLASRAIGLAPDYPGLLFNLARAELRKGVTGFGPAVSAYVKGLAVSVRYPRGLLIWAANLSFYLSIGLLAMILTFSTLLLVRHGSKLIHDIGDIFNAAPITKFFLQDMARSRDTGLSLGRQLARVFLGIVLVLAVLFPFFAGLGLLTSAVLGLVLASIYAGRSEIMAALLVLVAAFLMVPLGIVTNLPLKAEASLGSKIWACAREYCSSDQASVLERVAVESPEDTWTWVGLAYQKLHDAPGSAASLSTAATYLENAKPDKNGIVSSLLGNVLVLHSLASCPDGMPHAGNLATAAEHYESASRGVLSPKAALRGLAIAQGLLGKRTAMKETIDRLVALTQERDLEFQEKIPTTTRSDTVCRLLPELSAEMRTPHPPDWQLYLHGIDVMDVPPALPAKALLIGEMPANWFPIIVLLGLLAMPLVVPLARRNTPAARCPRCGNISCSRCDVRTSGFDYCPSCLFEQVRPAFIDPLDQVALQRQRDEKRMWDRVGSPLFALLVPGLVQMLKGRPIRGGLMLFGLVLSLAALIHPVPPLQDVIAYSGSSVAGLPMLPPVLLAIVFIWSAMDVWLRRE